MTLDHDELDNNLRKVVGILLKSLMILTSVSASYIRFNCMHANMAIG